MSNPDQNKLDLLNAPALDQEPHEEGTGAALAAALAGGGEANEFLIPEQKKSISGATVLFVGLAICAAGGLWLMHQRTGPAEALAVDPATQAARERIEQFRGGGSDSVAEMKSLLEDAE